jgi:hypothetical protein
MRALELGMMGWLSVVVLLPRAIRRQGDGDATTAPSATAPAPVPHAGHPGPWAERAACRDSDTALFFAADEISLAIARRLCRSCPVRGQCAAYALASPDVTGVWGGLTEADRRRIGGRVPTGGA